MNESSVSINIRGAALVRAASADHGPATAPSGNNNGINMGETYPLFHELGPPHVEDHEFVPADEWTSLLPFSFGIVEGISQTEQDEGLTVEALATSSQPDDQPGMERQQQSDSAITCSTGHTRTNYHQLMSTVPVEVSK